MKTYEINNDEYLQKVSSRMIYLMSAENRIFGRKQFDPIKDTIELYAIKCDEDNFEDKTTLSEDEYISLTNIENNYKSWVLIGDGGAGKSTYLRGYICRLSNKALKDSTVSIPVYIELNRYQGNLKELISESAEINDSDKLKKELSIGRFLLALDGLNEVATSYYKNILFELSMLTERYYKNRFIVTTRPNKFKNNFTCFQTFKIMPLTKKQINLFINRNRNLINTKLNLDSKNYSHINIPLTPLDLTFASMADCLNDIPSNSGQLIEKVIEGRFSWEESSLKAGYKDYGRSIKINCLISIAYDMTDKGIVACDKLTIGDILFKQLDKLHLQKIDWIEIYDAIISQGLMLENDREEVRFSYLRMQEYFCALGMLKNDQSLRFYEKIPQFKDSFFIALGLLGSPDEFIGSKLDIPFEVFHLFFHSNFCNVSFDKHLESIINLLSHPCSIVVEEATKIIIQNSPEMYDDIISIIEKKEAEIQCYCIKGLIIAENPMIWKKMIELLDNALLNIKAVSQIFEYNSKIFSFYLESQSLQKNLIDLINSKYLNTELKKLLMKSLCSKVNSSIEIFNNLIFFIEDQNNDINLRCYCASEMAFSCRYDSIDEIQHLISLIQKDKIADSIKIAIAKHIDKDGKYIDECLFEELMLEIYEEDEYYGRIDLEDYKYTESLRSTYSTDFTWEMASFSVITVEKVYRDLNEIVNNDIYPDYPDGLPYIDILNAIIHYSQSFQILYDLIKLYELVKNNKDLLSDWLTINIVFTKIIRVSMNLCDWTRYTNVKDKFYKIKAIIPHASSNEKVVQAINDQQPEIDIRLNSPHYRGQPRPVFTVINKPQQLIHGTYITIGENTMGDNINFSGNGNIAFGKDKATVNQTNIEYTANNKLLKEIKKLKDELSKINIDQNNREAIDIQFEILENNSKSDKKNVILMKSTLESIKTITQGALGSAMGAGLVEIFKRVGMMII